MKRPWLYGTILLVLLIALWGLVLFGSDTRYDPKPRVKWGSDRPPPQVVIFAVSGRCGLNCDAPNSNHEYLEEAGTVERLAKVFRERGKTVYSLAYRAHLLSDRPPISKRDAQYGFLQLEADFDWVRRNWPSARRVLLGHSHGVNWTHTLLRLHPDWTVDYLIDLDGVCSGWEEDNAPSFSMYERSGKSSRWKVDPSQACSIEAVRIRGIERLYDVKDVAYWGATYNLEVRTRTPYLHDAVPNVRPDGTNRGLASLVAREDHSAIVVPGSEALDWIARTLAGLEKTRDSSHHAP